MKYTIRTTRTESGKGYRHEFLRDGRLSSYAEYGPIAKPPARMMRWMKQLNRIEKDLADKKRASVKEAL